MRELNFIFLALPNIYKTNKLKRLCNKYISKLPTYTWSSFITRFVVIGIVGIFTMRFLVSVSDVPLEEIKIRKYLTTILSFNILSESIIAIDRYLEKIFPIPERLKHRFLIQTIFSILVIIIIYVVTVELLPSFLHDPEIPDNLRNLVLGFGLSFTIILVSGLLVVRMVDKWLFAQQEIEELKREKLKMDYNALQDQLNPHYLFNNLSVLKSLILYDKESAVKFTENFTDVYRYVLQSKDKMTVSLKDELLFVEAYIGIHKERLGDGLDIKISIEKEMLDKEIPPLTSQLLIENAIKHNIASIDNPLKIRISTESGYLRVKNRIQLKDTSYSTKTGLNNLIKRYQIVSDKEVKIENGGTFFKVSVPLL